MNIELKNKIKIINKHIKGVSGENITLLRLIWTDTPFAIDKKVIFRTFVVDHRKIDRTLTFKDFCNDPNTHIKLYEVSIDFKKEPWMNKIIEQYDNLGDLKFQELESYEKQLTLIEMIGIEIFTSRVHFLELEELINFIYYKIIE